MPALGTIIACTFLTLAIVGLILSHTRCRHGALSYCILLRSLPEEVRNQIQPELLISATRSYEGNEEDDDDADAGDDEAGGTQLVNLSLAAQSGLPLCTDRQLNKPQGDWILQEQPPYSYRCKWMQANYGCEKFPPTPLKWQPRVASDRECLYVDYDPVTAARQRATHVPPKRRPLLVIFVGDSFLRQVVEALACRFKSLVTVRRIPAGRVKTPKDGPIPQQPLRDHRGLCTTVDERFQNPPLRPLPGPCGDDALMLRFGQEMEVYFLFRASTTLQAVRWFNLKPEDVDVVVSEPRIWTGGGGHPRFDVAQLGRWRFNGTLVLITRGEARGTYPKCLTISVIRLRDDARSDGGHVCLPGSPDDAVRLLLGMIANPTEFAVSCNLPAEDYTQDGGQYVPLSSRGQVQPTGDKNVAGLWAQGFRFTLAEHEKQRFQKEWQGQAPINKTLHDVDDWIEASYNRNYTSGT